MAAIALAAGRAEAAITTQQAFVLQSRTAAFPGTSSYLVSAGNARLLVVGVSSTISTATSQTCTVTFGGQSLTQAVGNGGTLAQQHTWLFYLRDTPSVMNGANQNLVVTVSGGTSRQNYVYAGVYAGVDQTAPVAASQSFNSGGTSGSTVGPFATALAIGAGQTAVELVNLTTLASVTARTINTWASGWASAAGPNSASDATNNLAFSAYVAQDTTAGSTTSQHAASGNAISAMVAMSLAVSPTTTVGDGTNPTPAVTLPPGGPATMLDAFTLQTSAGTDTVTGATVTLAPANAFQNVGLVEITSDDGATVYGSASPASNTVAVTFGANVTATTTLTQYLVRITPDSHAAMPPVPGASYATTGTVTAIASTNAKAYSDAGSDTVTIDNLSPANPTLGAVTPGDARVTLAWTNPPDADFARVVVLRGTATIADVPTEGATYAAGNTIGASTVVYAGSLQPFVDTTVANGTSYYYRLFAQDTSGNYSQTGVQAGPVTPALITAQSPWAQQYAATAYPNGTVNASYAVGAGTNRVLVVAVASTRTSNGAITCSATYGGQALTLAAGDGTVATLWNHSFLFYLADTPALMDGTGRALAVTCSGGTPYYTWVHAAVYTGVDQTSPISDAKNFNSTAASTAVGPFSPALSLTQDDQAIEIVNLANSATSTTPRSVTAWATGWTTAGVQPAAITTNGPTAQLYIRDRAVPAATVADPSQHTASSTATYKSMTALVLRAPTVTTVGNGTDPSPAATVGPGGAATMLDAFTLQTSKGTDTISGATVTLAPASAYRNVALVEITNDAGTVVYGSATPASSAVAVALGTSITATTTSTQYEVRITPYAHAAMPPVPGASHATTGTVTALAGVNAHQVFSDAGSNTVTVDNLSPGNAVLGAVTATDARVDLSWGNPTDADFSQVVVLRSTAAVADVPAEGASYAAGGTIGASTVVYAGSGTAFADTQVVNETTYWYRIFAKDGFGNYSQGGVQAGPLTPHAPVPAVSPGPPTATANGCTQVTVRAPFSGDFYTSNSSTAFGRSTSAAGPFSTVSGCGAVTSASPRSCVDSAATASTTFYYQVAFTDPDGVAAPNPQVVSVTTPRCGFTMTVGGAAAAATTPAPGTAGVVVGTVTLRVTSGAGPVTLSSLGVQNTGTAVAGADVQTLQLFDDRGTVGALDAADVLLDTATWDGSRYVFSGLTYSVTAVGNNVLLALAVANGAAAGRTFTASVAAADVAVAFPDGVAGGYASATGATVAAPGVATEGDATPGSTRPLVQILNPSSGETVSGTFRLQVKTWVPGAAAVTNLQLSTNGGQDGYAFYAFNLAADRVASTANYDPDTAHATVFERQLSTLAPGAYALKARASNDGGATWVASGTVTVTVLGAGKGDGNLLVRDDSGQLCADCHSVKTHSSQTMGTKYGQWATGCRDCHTPHGTRNIGLVRETITPPNVTGSYQGSRNVYFSTAAGAAAVAGAANRAQASFANELDHTGPCQVCHTRTGGATPRWRNTGNSDPEHYSTTGSAGVANCTGCHSHARGFLAPESKGNELCRNCHPKIANSMAGSLAGSPAVTPSASKHSLVGYTDTFADSGGNWAVTTNLSDIPAAQRSCVNMCHLDHVHNAPGGTTHDANVATNAATAAGRLATRTAQTDPLAADYRLVTGPAGVTSRTDFDDAATSKGLCISCHTKPVSAAKPAIPAAAYAAGAHNSIATSDGTTTYQWKYALHDGSTFDRNCTKCHASRKEGTTPASAGVLSAVHGTDDPNLLAGTTSPAGAAAGFVCYNCHGSAASPAAGAPGNRSNKNIQAQIQKTSNHPSIADAAHDSAAESTNAVFGNQLGGVARHANCIDCHDPHDAKAGTHAVTTNVAGPPLEGAWGAQLSSNPAFWAVPTSASFTKKTIVAGTDLEATLCFKCHSSFYGTLPASPSGGFAETDTAREFNPANAGNWATAGTANQWSAGETAGGFHPVVANAAGNLGAVNMANLVTTSFAWRTSGARNLMTCTDCHESDTTADPNGPHGSSAGFILRGPNTAWNASILNANSIPAGTFCLNCHSQTFASSRFPDHNTQSAHFVACFNCHAAIPHGGPRPGMLNPAAGVGANLAAAAGWDGVAPYWQGAASGRLYLVSYPTSATSSWQQGNCGCNGTGH